MHTQALFTEHRRLAPRIELEAFASEIVEHKERHAVVLDLSQHGVLLARPFFGGRTTYETVQLEVELPGIDEIVWAKGQICYERVRPPSPTLDLPLGRLVRESGIRIVAAATRDLRLIRDYVHEACLRGMVCM
jgi:hypothetical protein